MYALCRPFQLQIIAYNNYIRLSASAAHLNQLQFYLGKMQGTSYNCNLNFSFQIERNNNYYNHNRIALVQWENYCTDSLHGFLWLLDRCWLYYSGLSFSIFLFPCTFLLYLFCKMFVRVHCSCLHGVLRVYLIITLVPIVFLLYQFKVLQQVCYWKYCTRVWSRGWYSMRWSQVLYLPQYFTGMQYFL